jgi:hypothetical protein
MYTRSRAATGEEYTSDISTVWRGKIGVTAKLVWPGALIRWGRGPDGADKVLLAEADPTDVARRFDRLVIASGDHIFGALANEVRARLDLARV